MKQVGVGLDVNLTLEFVEISEKTVKNVEFPGIWQSLSHPSS
jgi:hypothetical protein